MGRSKLEQMQLFFTCFFVVNFVEKNCKKLLVIRDQTEESENAEEEERR